MLKQKKRVVTLVLIIIICTAISYFYLAQYNEVSNIHEEETKNTIINIKKIFLKNTIDNLVADIEWQRENAIKQYSITIDTIYEILANKKDLTDEEFSDYFIKSLNADFNDEYTSKYLTIILWNKSTGRVLYDPEYLFHGDISSTEGEIEKVMAYYKIIDHGNISGMFGVSQALIDNKVKETVAENIRRLRFDGSYIWVNEIINYEGGNNYAIRRVHPNFPETEGSYLSTDMVDIKGNHPYLTELEGVKEQGELFFTYHFKELNSNKISEKLSYAKLYKDFNWIIAIGIHTNEIQQYITETNEKSNFISAKLRIQLIVMVIIVVVFCIFLLIMWEIWYLGHERKKIELENHKDTLTKACTRKYGTKDLEEKLKEFKSTDNSPAIVVFDIDKFKEVNDTFGHYVGDQVLKEVVNTVYQNIRSSDKLIRWGGDEFVGIFYGIEKDNALYFGEKILSSISNLRIPNGDKVITPTISMGISYFQCEDTDIKDVINRADQALYKAKREGRNRVSLL